jgi:hypothetical protein
VSINWASLQSIVPSLFLTWAVAGLALRRHGG